jgi:hypothetical protein
MGLDSYLYKITYLGAKYEHNHISGSIKITKKDTPVNIDLKKISEIKEEVGCWRKANHIHNWFVKNVQDGKDECQDAWVSLEDLKRLLNTCNEVLKDNSQAPELLPTKDGFFFGSTDYDKYYFQTIQYTVEVCEIAIKAIEEDKAIKNFVVDIIYSSSW